MFRNRPTKKVHTDDRQTLFSKDKEMIAELQKQSEDAILLQMNLDKVQQKIDKIQNSKKRMPSDMTTLQLLRNEYRNLSRQLSSVQNDKHLINYELSTSQLRQEYANRCKSQSSGNRICKKKVQSSSSTKQTNNVMSYFTKAAPQKVEKKAQEEKDVKKERSRADILEEYMKCVDDNYMSDNSRKKRDYIEHRCPDCDVEYLICPSRANMVCPKCKYVEEFIDNDMNPPSYKELERKNMTSSTGYKRQNHFIEWLSQFQAKERTSIPEDVFLKIREEMRKQNFTKFQQLEPKKTRDFLKKLGYSDYYEHVICIMSSINDVPPPSLDPETEEMLKRMFADIQAPWEKVKPPDRKNFLSYSYTIHKFCELLELDELLQYFPLLKNPERLREQDNCWKKICAILKWEFYPSI